MRPIVTFAFGFALWTVLAPVAALAAPGPDSAYVQDPTNTYVEERSARALGTINEILCSIGQTKYADLLAADADGVLEPYKALIDTRQCASDRDSSENSAQGSQSQGSATQVPDYEEWLVQASQPGHTGPLTLMFWIDQDEEGQAMQIQARVTITEGPSEAMPYGKFRLDFAMYVYDGDTLQVTPFGRGYMQAVQRNGEAVLEFVDNFGVGIPGSPWTSIEQVALRRTGQSSGSGTTYQWSQGDWGTESEQFNFAYDANNFLRVNPTVGGSEVCLDKGQFNTNVWRYGLYNADSGARLNRSSGFPVKYTDSLGTTYHGWIGYYGMWFPESATIATGDTVYKQTFGSGGQAQDEAYEAFAAGGKLVKHTKQTLTLGDFVGVPLSYWDNGTDYRVAWNGDNFAVQAKRGDNGVWGPLAPEDPLTVDMNSGWDQLHFWSQERGGSVRVKLDCPAGQENPFGSGCNDWQASDSSEVVFYSEDIVYPGDTNVPSTLLCLENCPDATTINDANDSNDNHATQSWQDAPPASATMQSYTFDATTYEFLDGATAVVQSSGSWGISSGVLFPAESRDQMACDWDTNQTCGWKAWDLDVYYTWQTGPNNWNRLTGLKDPDDDTFLTFEAPLQVKYVKADTGASYILEYNGFGDLHGIPGRCVDWDTGGEAQCGENTRWVSEFSIPTGSTVTANNGTSYLVKALEMEKQMKQASVGACDDLTPTALSLPVIADWQAPAIGAAPEVNAAARVIGGVIQ